MIDTQKLARHMQERGGMAKEASEALAEGINEAAIDQLVTKKDLDQAIALLDARLSKKIYAVGFIVFVAIVFIRVVLALGILGFLHQIAK